jgi:hypothetical protein
MHAGINREQRLQQKEKSCQRINKQLVPAKKQEYSNSQRTQKVNSNHQFPGFLD